MQQIVNLTMKNMYIHLGKVKIAPVSIEVIFWSGSGVVTCLHPLERPIYVYTDFQSGVSSVTASLYSSCPFPSRTTRGNNFGYMSGRPRVVVCLGTHLIGICATGC